MTTPEKNFREMQKNCISYARDNENLWSGKIKLKENILLLETNDKELDQAASLQKANNPAGIVDQKNDMKSQIIATFFSFECKLAFYALDSNDQVLLNEVNYSESELKKTGENDLLVILTNMINRGKEYLSKLTDYEMTAAEIADLEITLNEMKQLPISVDITSNERKQATRSIKEINSDARFIMEKLDKGFTGMLAKNKDFLQGWADIRKIKGRPARNKKSVNKTKAMQTAV